MSTLSQFIRRSDTNDDTTTTSGTSVNKQILYDSFVVANEGEPYPITVSSLTSTTCRQANYVWQTWESVFTYSKVKLVCNNGAEYIGGPFTTREALVSWINSVVPNSGGTLSVTALLKVYDEVSYDIPVLQKMYGINTLYASLVGGKNIRSSSTKTGFYGGSMWLDIFVDLATHYKDLGLIGDYVTKSDLESDNSNFSGDPDGIGTNKIFWIGANKRNLYGIPKEDSMVNLSSSVPADYRKFWDTDAGGVSIDQTSSDEGGYTLIRPAYVVFDESDNTWSIVDTHSTILSFQYAFDSDDKPTVIVYLIKHFNDGSKFAFYVKPIGINTVYVDYFDTSKYRLEAVGFAKNSQPLVKVCSGNIVQDFYGDTSRINKSNWFFPVNISATKNAGTVLPRKVKFRLRRLSDGKVGNYSSGTITPIIKTRGSLLKWMIV